MAPSEPTNKLLARIDQMEQKMSQRMEKMENALTSHKVETDARMREQQDALGDKDRWHTAAHADQQYRLDKMEGMLTQILNHVHGASTPAPPAHRSPSPTSPVEPAQKNQIRAKDVKQ